MDPRPELVNHYTSGSNIYEIPVFQRNYEWEEEKWFGLWNDIRELYNTAVYNMNKDSALTIENALQKRTHFIGTILSRAVSPLGGGLGHRYTVIDGQQRLITLFIVLAAIRDEEVGEFNKIPDEDTLSYAKGKNKYQRFVVNRVDSKLFKKILEGSCKNGLTASDSETLLGRAYLFYRYQLKLGVDFKLELEDDFTEIKPPKPSRKKDAPQPGDFLKYWPVKPDARKYNLELLQNCINYGLSILEIILEEDDEDDAIIFETINAMNTPLEKFDLIRNSFFLRLGEKAEAFFEQEWLGFQNKLEQFRSPRNSKVSKDQFVYDYLIFRGLEKVSATRLYSKWKIFVSREMGRTGGDKGGEYFLEAIARPMLQASLIYPASWGATSSVGFEEFRKPIPVEVSKLITEIISVTSGPTIPLHMTGLNAWLKGELSNDELLVWFKKIQGMILRLVLSGEGPTNVRASVLATAPKFSKDISINNLTILMRESFRQPNDATLKNLIATSQVANDGNAAAMGIILRGIERQIRKTSAHPLKAGSGAADWQIEHIYPQADSGPGSAWIQDLTEWKLKVENYEQLKFTLGNITFLTGTDNKIAAQKPFNQKQKIFKETHLGVNDDLLLLRGWKPKNIQDRSTFLLSHFLEEWPE
jgi:uncharacterized protein with ParB-like and HNH nuclease domain